MKKACLNCGVEVKGRADKKFCSAICKTKHHVATKRLTSQNDVVKIIDSILHRNHQILTLLMSNTKTKKVVFPRLVLERAAFNFNYYTGTYINNQNKTYFYIYDFAWMPFSNQEVLVIMKGG